MSAYGANSDLCFFGGWPSLKMGDLCRRPWGFDMSERFGRSYDKEHFCGHADLFRCNPVLFGPGKTGSSFDENNGGVESGLCINFRANGHSIRDVTDLCMKASEKNLDLLYLKYKADEEYRDQFDKMKEEIGLFCEENPHYSACGKLLGRVSLLNANFACVDEMSDSMPVSSSFTSYINSMISLSPSSKSHNNKDINDPKRDNKERAPASSCEELFGGKDVLYIGDSHSYLTSKNGSRMGNKIANRVKECGSSSFHYRGVCGSRPANWMPGKTPSSRCGVSSMGPDSFSTQNRGQTENLSTLSEKTGAKVVMINLGDNMFSWKSSGGRYNAYIRSSDSVQNEVSGLLKVLKEDQKCVWIGPAYHSPGKSYSKSNAVVDEMYEALDTAIGNRCKVIDSRPYFSNSLPNDGLHFTSGESSRWGSEIAKDL